MGIGVQGCEGVKEDWIIVIRDDKVSYSGLVGPDVVGRVKEGDLVLLHPTKSKHLEAFVLAQRKGLQ